jgi:hypothetical protein
MRVGKYNTQFLQAPDKAFWMSEEMANKPCGFSARHIRF